MPRNHCLLAMKNAFTVLTAALCSHCTPCGVLCFQSRDQIFDKGRCSGRNGDQCHNSRGWNLHGGCLPEFRKGRRPQLVAALTPYYPGSTVSSTGSRSVYLIEPKILHWEDRATEWSGKADRVKVSLPLYRSGSLVGSALVTANSSWWTFGGDHPEDLLDTPFEVLLRSRWPAKQIQIAWFSSDRQTLCLLLGRAPQL